MNEKVKKIEREFSEARREIMQLRVENRKLESALSSLSKPMVLSDDESGTPQSKRNRSESSGTETIVVALPQGEAQERIDSLLVENLKLADEIAELRQGGNVSSLYEKNSTLSNQVNELESRLADVEKNHLANLKTIRSQADKEIRQLRCRIMYVP
jgi:hypothetical protein